MSETQPSALKNLSFDPHVLASEQLHHVYRDRNSALVATLLGGAILAVILSLEWKPAMGLGWYAFLSAVSLWHWFMGRPEQSGGGTPLSGMALHVAAAGIAGLGWGSAALALPWLGLTAQATALVVLMIAANAALPRMVIFLPQFYAFMAGIFTPVVLVLPFLDSSGRQLTCTVLAATAVMLWISARDIRRVLVRILLKQVSFEQVSWEDRLTGLGNRRRFDDALDSAWGQALRLGVPLSLMILDVDHFKKFNDTYGHPAGDDCLRKVAKALAGCVKRSGDSVARYGGEEFAAVMFHAPMADARYIGEQMCQAVMEMGLPHEQSSHGVVTVSIGGATAVPMPGMSAQDLVNQADAALYRAKEAGRNRVEWNMVAHS